MESTKEFQIEELENRLEMASTSLNVDGFGHDNACEEPMKEEMRNTACGTNSDSW